MLHESYISTFLSSICIIQNLIFMLICWCKFVFSLNFFLINEVSFLGCISFLGLMEKAMATHSSTLAWEIAWMEEPSGLQSMGSLRVGHDWATSLSCIGEGNGNPLQCCCLENPRDGGAWWAAVYDVAQNWTRLKRLSSSSSSSSRTGSIMI